MKKYCECGTFVADIKEGSKLQKGMKFCCNKCEVRKPEFLDGFEKELSKHKMRKFFVGAIDENCI